MPLPKMPERMPINLIGNDVTYTRDCIKWAGGFNQCLDIAEKMVEAIVERLNEVYIKMTEEKTDCYCSQYLYNFLQELQPPEQSPKGEENK